MTRTHWAPMRLAQMDSSTKVDLGLRIIASRMALTPSCWTELQSNCNDFRDEFWEIPLARILAPVESIPFIFKFRVWILAEGSARYWARIRRALYPFLLLLPRSQSDKSTSRMV